MAKPEMKEPTDLVETEQLGIESQVANEIAKAGQQSEIYIAALIAHKFPRDEEQCMTWVRHACENEKFAGRFDEPDKPGVYYQFPRGGTTVIGPSIKLMREVARQFGHIRSGFVITQDDDDGRAIVGYAWDVQRNVHWHSADYFKKLIQRKDKQGNTRWVTPDERELRELTNKYGSIVVRNCIARLVPEWFIDECITVAKKTVTRAVTPKNIKERTATMVEAFARFGVNDKQLAYYLKKPLAKCEPEDLANLRGVYEAMRDGQITQKNRDEMFGSGKAAAKKKAVKVRAHPDQSDPHAASLKGEALGLISGITKKNLESVRGKLRDLYPKLPEADRKAVADAFEKKTTGMR